MELYGPGYHGVVWGGLVWCGMLMLMVLSGVVWYSMVCGCNGYGNGTGNGKVWCDSLMDLVLHGVVRYMCFMVIVWCPRCCLGWDA